MTEQELLAQLKDINEFIPTPWWQTPWPYMVALGVLTLAAVLFLLLRWRKRVIQRPLTLWEQALKDLDALSRQTDAARFYQQLTDILKSYLQARYSVPIRHLTDYELLQQGNFGMPASAANLLFEIFGSVTAVKFAGQTVLYNALERDLQRAKQIVQLTMPLPERT